jgi:hypothetical protein
MMPISRIDNAYSLGKYALGLASDAPTKKREPPKEKRSRRGLLPKLQWKTYWRNSAGLCPASFKSPFSRRH